MAIASGMYDVVLVGGVEKITRIENACASRLTCWRLPPMAFMKCRRV